MPREGSGVRIVVTPIPLASRERSRQEDSHSGRVRTLGKRVKGNLSRVQIPHPPLEEITYPKLDDAYPKAPLVFRL